MAAKSNTAKFIRDPIHNIIRIQPEDRFILDLLDSAAMQRLRRIRQLGLASLVYPGAEHTRFTHSIGVFHLAGRVVTQLDQVSDSKRFSCEQRQAVLAAAILHDIGHGPFSHVFENITKEIGSGQTMSHEDWTVKIVNEDKEIRNVLDNISTDLAKQVRQILDHTYKPHYVTAIVSSQLDVDRFDYLLRDSHMSGARYGAFDLEWLLRTLAIAKVRSRSSDGAVEELETIVVDGQRGLSGLESHIIGRHYMYRHVYYHKTIRSAEQMLRTILKRAAELVRKRRLKLGSNAFQKMARGESLELQEYLELDDFLVMSWIEEWARSVRDPVLKDLSTRLLNRRLFKTIVIPAESKTLSLSSRALYAHNKTKLQELVKQRGFDPDWYLLEDEVKDLAYKGYMYNLSRGKPADEEEIWFVDSEGVPQRLSGIEKSILVKASDVLDYKEDRLFIPAELEENARTMLEW